MANPVILVYSSNAQTRAAIVAAIGRRPAADVGLVDFLECSTLPEVLLAVDSQAADLLVLDGEAQPVGGIGICRQLHQELPDDIVVPPVMLLVGRAADRWLATWARADEVLLSPPDPVTAAEAAATLLRRLGSEQAPVAAELTG
ncbi:hypothetical protein [Nakamurella aerolata]|uniref:Response regulatory domain-containing protein n=1 Tax=Nakamurella aerolata TaxID=1656892 RepID=A0A849A4W0_9ACTN|nr:hypothetical protein [Nakamurella aerolata]NNG34666.1 hypothetical protein [Nakamurella aerolata]